MATNTFVELNLPEAADLADLTGVHYDLESAKDLAVKLRAMISVGQTRDFPLIDALSTAILVRYSRAFVEGVRKRLQQDALQELSDTQQMNHEYFIELRHKHIAHSVNSFEESAPVARYWVERVDTEGITSIECNHHIVMGMGTKDLDAIIELVDALLQFVNKTIAQEKKRLLAIVRAMPLAVVMSGAGRVTVPGRGPVNKARKRRETKHGTRKPGVGARRPFRDPQRRT